MTTSPMPPWAAEIPEGAFISDTPTYKVGEYFSLFEQDAFDSGASVGKLKYWFFDPTAHGYPAKDDYPLIIFLHGSGNALVGDVCINYTGAEFFATDAYQKKLGGAYLLVPVANEYRNEEGRTCGGWGPEYTEPVNCLIEDFIGKHTHGVGKMILMGNSRGASFTFEMGNAYTGRFAGLIPIGTSDIPTDEKLDEYDAKGVELLFAVGKRDEFNPYAEAIAPRVDKLNSMKHCTVFIPEWVYNGDKGIASINVGIEMGQHCLINPMHCNLMFDDGTPMYPEMPDGVLGWMKKVIEEEIPHV